MNNQTILPFSSLLKKLSIFVMFLFCLFSANAQNQQYYLEIKSGYELGAVDKTNNLNGTLSFSMENTSFASFLSSKSLYSFEKAFPFANNIPRLQRVYVISLSESTSINDFINRNEVEKIILIDDEILLTGINDIQNPILPSDYEDIIEGGRNVMLDLIRAPQAWTVTIGDSSILVGVADSKFEFNHEDLQGQILDNILINNSNVVHGTRVASLIAAKTDNNIGIASVGYNTKLVTASCGGGAIGLINGLIELSEYSGIRVINCSWAICYTSSSIEYLDEAMAYVNEKDILVVASAGNGVGQGSGMCGDTPHGYRYPGSYDEAISVTSVGHKFPIGNVDPVFGAGAWEDCHKNTPGSSTSEPHTHNDKVNISAPGWHNLRADEPNTYTNYSSGTSQSAPIVSGVAALVFAANPNLTAQQAKDIILNTADNIYHIPYNQEYIGLLGTGRVNTYRAVLTAKCMDDPNYEPTLDLMVKNSIDDFGEEPDNNTGQVLWNSSDIWVRNQANESYIRTHQNPEYDPNNPNYVYVRVTNRSCVTSSGSEELKLYWSKANTALSWPSPWDGSLTVGNNIPLGGQIGTLTIPSLDSGEEAILEFPWMIPNPEDYIDLNPNPWHFCLLARIDTPNDPMNNENTNVVITNNVRNNNNIAWKNLTVVDIEPNTVGIGGVIGVSNPTNQTKTYRLEFVVDTNEIGKAVYEEAEVGVEMDDVLFDAWERGNKTGSHFKTTANEKKVVATNNNMVIDNIQFDPNEYGTAYITFNFLTKELTDKVNYTYHVIQKDASNDSIVGGETYTIRKKRRAAFLANAGSDEIVEKNETITLQASQINEDAVYNWYDPAGNLIYTGTDLTVSPEVTQQYRLEIISDLDGLKDYDEVSVTVTPYRLGNLIPNPASTQVTVSYTADEAESAYIMVVNQTTAVSNNYILNTQEESLTIDISSYPSGLYSVVLVCDGEVQSVKTLAKE